MDAVIEDKTHDPGVISVCAGGHTHDPDRVPAGQRSRRAAAKSLGMALRRVDASTPAELTAAFAAIRASSSEALLVQSGPFISPLPQSCSVRG
jgi:hypothetical protein